MPFPASLLAERMQAVLGICRAQGITVITSMSAANPVAAARKVVEVARGLGLFGPRVAAVTAERVRTWQMPCVPDAGTGHPGRSRTPLNRIRRTRSRTRNPCPVISTIVTP
ncbi:acyclic terpene utilization AtuA family protein [Roseomonas gilardii]|uniref:acyclic terpene utilization AtuA family protein n=1 Tax=Roseomonas gilardii TaxID=257708 RepID=UPI00119C92D8|nr:acyclic terpene utilization AtuA family protein [Roseomonas gilardii]